VKWKKQLKIKKEKEKWDIDGKIKLAFLKKMYSS